MTDTITRILVPVDFSGPAQRACEYAFTLAPRLSATITLVHVVEDPYVTGAWASEVYVPNMADVLQALTDAATQQLTDIRRTATARGLTIDTIVVNGRPADAIVDYARTGRFDLILMGTHGRSGLSHVVMGSVAERVIRKAPCPVLTLHGGAADGHAQPAAA